MKIIMICGSPRRQNSTSYYLLQALQEKLNGNEIIMRQMSEYKEEEAVINDVIDAEAIILAFPLYVDGIPASLLGVLRKIENVVKGKNTNCKVYAIINNGFYDARQNEIAMDMVWKWCDKCDLKKGYAIGAGAGGMLKMTPIGYGPNIKLGKVIDQLGRDIQNGNSGETKLVEPNFPRIFYKTAAHFNWRMQGKQNGLKARELRKND